MQSLGHPSFSFQYVSHDQVLKEVNKLNPRKASQDSDIQVKVIRENIDIVAYFIYNNFNNSLSSFIFPTGLKYADIKPVFKKDDKTNKENYRPISILPNLSKIYERLMGDQLYPYFNKIFSKFQCGFRKGFNSQQCLLSMIEKWRRSLDSGGHAGAFLTDLSKAFDCINHELLIAKLHAYGLDHGSLSFIHSYLSHRKQRTKVNSSYSDFAEIIFGVPQGSILGPLLFNIYICDLFFEDINLDVANYADDTTPYSSGSDFNTILNNLQKGVEKIFEWFLENRLKANADKCHLLLSSKDHAKIEIANYPVYNIDRVKLLGVHTEGKLNFDFHVSQLCKKASQKLHALARICKYMDTNKRRMLMKSFITSQFSYCPLIWMFHSRTIEHRINRIHERALRLVYDQSHELTFDQLLVKDNSVSIHQKNLQVLATEIFKAKNGIAPTIMAELFQFTDKPYNLRSKSILQRTKDCTVYHGTKSISSLAPKIWELIPNDLKEENSVAAFKDKIKKWTNDKCPCRLCKKYVAHLGFI